MVQNSNSSFIGMLFSVKGPISAEHSIRLNRFRRINSKILLSF